MILFVDGDACPVKDEIYRTALRHDLKVYVVSNGLLRAPAKGRVEIVRVKARLDAADDWIVGRAAAGDIVITADIPLADRCVKKGVRVIAPDGRLFTEDSIGEAMAGRELMDQLRQMGVATGGPTAFGAADRRRFLASLTSAIATL